MYNIGRNGIITATRGDTFSFDVTINIGSEMEPVDYILKNDDKLYFALLEPNQRWEDAVLKKAYSKYDLQPNNKICVRFETEDTEYLVPGIYYYMIKLNRVDTVDSEVDTIIPKTKFILLE